MKVFAHRGESAIFPENSQTAIAACHHHDMDGIEIDIYQTDDDQFVVYHDRWMTRILGLNKKTIELTYDDLQQLLGKDDKPIPTLDWTIQTLSQSGLMLNIELKYVRDIELFYRQLLSSCQSSQFDINQLIISSFNHQYLAEFAQLSSFIKIGYLLGTHPAEADALEPSFPIYSVHLDMDCLSAQLVQRFKQLGYPVFVFTVDQSEELLWLQEIGVDGVFSNNPKQVFTLLNNASSTK